MFSLTQCLSPYATMSGDIIEVISCKNIDMLAQYDRSSLLKHCPGKIEKLGFCLTKLFLPPI